jgi:hypothetical protein
VLTALWWTCFVILALEVLLQLAVIVVYWPLTGDAPTAANFIGLGALPLALLALNKARDAQRKGA